MAEARSEFVMVPTWLRGAVAMRCIGVYAGLRAFDAPGGFCNPTEAEVARMLGISVSTVKRAVRDLLAANAIRLRSQRRGSRNTYSFPARKGQSFSKVPVALFGQVSIGSIGVYSVLRSFDGPRGCYPAIATVAERAGLSHTATQDALRLLRGIGAIEVAARYKPGGAPTSNSYRFPDLLRQTPSTAEGGTKSDGAERQWGHQPGVTEVMGRAAVGSPTGHKPENLTKESEQEIVSRCPPTAVGQGLNEKSRTAAKDSEDEAAQGGNLDPGLIEGDSPVTTEKPWYHGPLDDPAVERLVWELVDTLAEELALSGGNEPAVTTREAWARTARVMLVHDKRDHARVYEIIRKACIDVSWSKAIRSMWDISRNWDRLVATFEKREPKRFKPKVDKLAEEVGRPPVDYKTAAASFGLRSLSDLPDWKEDAATSLDGQGLSASDPPSGTDPDERSRILAKLRSIQARRDR